jgi:hypothetical protein
MLALLMGLLVASRGDLTVDEPHTQAFGTIIYSEAICENHRQRYCEDKDTRVGISAAPFFIYDFGEELKIIYKGEKCMGATFVSYDDIRSKNRLWQVLSGPSICVEDKQGRLPDIAAQLDDIYAASRHMKERASVVFGPISKRCKVRRDKSGWPISSTCAQ